MSIVKMTKQKQNCLICGEVLFRKSKNSRKKLVLIVEAPPNQVIYTWFVILWIMSSSYAIEWTHWTAGISFVASADNQFKLSSYTSEHLQS